jgi:predicted metal-dependent peptidase
MGTEIQLSALMKNIEEKLQKAKAKLMLEHPYFGSIASALEFIPSDDIESFESNGTKFTYNDDFLKQCSVEETEFALANAAMHYALEHQNRAGRREGWLWQLATDYAINVMLIKNNLYPPDHINYQPRFEGMYAEEIYAILESEIDEKEYVEEKQKSEKIKHTESEDAEFLEQLLQKAIAQDELPKDLDRFFPQIKESKIDWRSALYQYVHRHAKEDYRFFPPNKRYIHQGFALPSLQSELLKIVVAIDTSGSIAEDLLAQFFAEFEAIMQSFSNYEIDLITCDSKIQYHQTFYPGDLLLYQTKGGGGTDFRPVFEFIAQQIDHPALLLYFTDAQGRFPEFEPTFDTLWIVPQEEEVPFGEVLIIEK